MTPLTAEQIRRQIQEIIGDVADLDPEAMADNAHLVEDLGLDSLSLLEVSVDVDYHFKLGLEEDRLKNLRTLQDIVDIVQESLDEKAVAGS